MNNPSTLDTVGTSMTFPLKITEKGKLIVSSGWDVLRGSIINILSFNHRFFLYQFGVGLENYLEEPNDDIVKSQLEYDISDQISLFDPRLYLEDLDVARTDDNTLSITVKVKLKGTNFSEIFTYPENSESTL